MIFRKRRPSHVVELFSTQFEEDGEAFIYRKNGTGAAYRVTQRERDDFIDDFRRGWRMAVIGIVTATLLLCGALVMMDVDAEGPGGYLFGFAICVPVFLWTKRLYAAPEARLQNRRVLARAMTADESRHHALSQISYAQLACAPLAGLLIVTMTSSEVDVTQGWGRTVWLVPIALTVLAVVQARRKTRPTR